MNKHSLTLAATSGFTRWVPLISLSILFSGPLSAGLGQPIGPKQGPAEGPVMPRLEDLDATRAQVVRGTPITVTGSNFPRSVGDITLKIDDQKSTFNPVTVTSGTPDSFTFVVPQETSLGFHTVWI